MKRGERMRISTWAKNPHNTERKDSSVTSFSIATEGLDQANYRIDIIVTEDTDTNKSLLLSFDLDEAKLLHDRLSDFIQHFQSQEVD